MDIYCKWLFNLTIVVVIPFLMGARIRFPALYSEENKLYSEDNKEARSDNLADHDSAGEQLPGYYNQRAVQQADVQTLTDDDIRKLLMKNLRFRDINEEADPGVEYRRRQKKNALVKNLVDFLNGLKERGESDSTPMMSRLRFGK